MKMLLFKRSWLSPLILVSMFMMFLASCEKDEDPPAKTLDVTVNFTGNTVPEAGDLLSIVIFNTDVSTLDVETAEPDVIVDVELTQDMIDNGIAVNLDTIDLEQAEMYIGAFVDLDGDENPSPGDLIEFFEDVAFIDAFFNDVLPTNIAGLSEVTINFDEVLTLPSLDVTVNFTSQEIVSSAGDVLHLALFYTSLEGMNMETDMPDDEKAVILTADDIDQGITLTFEDLDPAQAEIYIGVFVDTNDNGPEPGELIEVYQDKDFMEVLAGDVEATNAKGESEITINLDSTIAPPEM